MKAFVINLDSRPDRMEAFKKNKFPFEVERFPAITASCGEDGCTRSHIALLKQQKEFPFVIFEDDCTMLQSWDVVEKAMSQLPVGWDALYLGATLRKPLIRHSENLYRLRKGWTTHAIIYGSKRMVNFIVNHCHMPSGENIDIFYLHRLQPAFNCFITYPLVATQMNGYSDICKKDVDYHDVVVDAYNTYMP
jgi:hypothetical protein